MRLSEAIMLGSTMRPQGFHRLFTNDINHDITHSCALGAALDAVGKSDEEGVFRIWRWIEDKMYPCPECDKKQTHAVTVIAHLNDNHRWTRERIAEWVATIEPKDDVPEVELTETPVLETVCK